MQMSSKNQIILVKETRGESLSRTYRYYADNRKNIHISEVSNVKWASITTFFMTVFLPHGFPESVSKDYVQYQLWDSIQAFASSITGSIATHAVLKGAGVGDENASPLAATITWIVKDGTSMMGRILFAWLQGTKLDSDCKKWRLFADILNDIAIFLDMASGYCSEYFMPIICISGVFKSVVGVAGGATRAALTQHQARQNNMADVSAKDGSQETLVNLVALICSLLIIPVVVENITLTWLVFILMTTTHLGANYFAVKSVVMETFNKTRFRIYMDYYLQKNMEKYLSVEEVNNKESVLPIPWNKSVQILLGESFSKAITGKSYDEVLELINLYENCDYFLSVSSQQTRNATIYICFKKFANQNTQLEAMYQACILENMLQGPKKIHNSSVIWDMYNSECQATNNKIFLEKLSRKLTQNSIDSFKSQLEKQHWNISTVMFDTEMWRIELTNKKIS